VAEQGKRKEKNKQSSQPNPSKVNKKKEIRLEETPYPMPPGPAMHTVQYRRMTKWREKKRREGRRRRGKRPTKVLKGAFRRKSHMTSIVASNGKT
jgi:hypothetical protein